MLYYRDIGGVRINFVLDARAVAGGGRSIRGQLPFLLITTHIGAMAEVLQRIPGSHLALLREVPIIIFNGRGRGGWCSPDRRGNPGPTMQRWLDQNRVDQRGFEVDVGEVAGCPHSNGIITISTRVLQGSKINSIRAILHETGHCVDHHLNLTSTPPAGSSRYYREGNLAYQGQDYPNVSYDEYEFKAETYARLFYARLTICRRGDADPPCLGEHRGHRKCSTRLKRDLSYTPAFQMLGPGMNNYLRLPADAIEREDSSASARGPIGRRPSTILANSQLNPRAQGRVPGPVGLA